MSKILTIDIGGTNTRVALFQNMKLKWIEKFSTDTNSFLNEVKLIKNIVKTKNEEFDCIGLAAPGPADYQKGIFFDLPNMPKWQGTNFIEILQKELATEKIIADNDANLMALAHHHFFKNENGITQFYTISTGLGSGLIINNKIFSGYNGFAQEIAKLPTAFSKEKGKGLSEGAVELFSAGSGLETRAKLQAKEIFAKYKTDNNCKKIVDEGIESLANLFAISIATINPNLIVYDGSVARYNDFYVKKAIEIAKERVFDTQLKDLEFKAGKLGDDSCLYGCAYNASNKFLK